MENAKIKKEQRKCFKCGMPFVATLVLKAFSSNEWWGPLACSSCCNAQRRQGDKTAKATQRKLWNVCSDP